MGLVVLMVGLMGAGVEPVVSWFYLFAWYPVLLAAEGAVALAGLRNEREGGAALVGGARGVGGERGEREGEDGFLLLSRGGYLLSVLGWSAVIWLFYELFNLRLQNWYYVFVPEDRVLRWVFTALAFATVLPAVFLAEALLERLGVAARVRWRGLGVTEGRLRGLQITGVIFLALVLIWPRWFFPLVWGGTTLIVEPWVYRRDAGRSILGDLEKGQPGRLLRLLLGGMAIGLLWEALNIGARAKWIYTVPGLEEFKLFEMPVLGFFGFPPFALECFVLWQALVLLGWAVPREEEPAARRAVRSRRIGGALIGAVFSLLVLAAMEGRTWDSYRPRLDALENVPAERLRAAGYDAFDLAAAAPSAVAAAADTTETAAREWIDAARLATLRGIGTDHAATLRSIGIVDVHGLAATDPAWLHEELERVTGRRWVPARLRVWVRAAVEQTAGSS